MPLETFPLIKLELQLMRATVMTALTRHAAELDSGIREALERCCTSENLERAVNECVAKELEAVIQEEIRSFFRYGKGRATLKSAVCAVLDARVEQQ